MFSSCALFGLAESEKMLHVLCCAVGHCEFIIKYSLQVWCLKGQETCQNVLST